MRQKCEKTDCPAPKGLCLEHASSDYPKCEHWLGNAAEQDSVQRNTNRANAKPLPWTGEALQPADLSLVSERSAPLIIGMIGGADAGKTSYLGMLYTLLFNGKTFENWHFAGSYTLAAWETLAQYLKIKPGGVVEFAPPTPSNPDYYSLSHLALKKSEIFRDVLFADSSGEVFNLWSENTQDPNAVNARWIYEKANSFIFMVDCVALIEKRGAAKSSIVQMAEQIVANLDGRPVAIVWSKADRLDEVRENIRSALAEDLTECLSDAHVFEVSNYSKSDPDTLCHKNNLAVTEYLIEKMNEPSRVKITPAINQPHDFFFDFKGRHEVA